MTSHSRGLISDIQRFSVHDGPGIRDLVFMKGCPLRCLWCSNPELQNGHPEIAYIQNRCIDGKNCGRCGDACPTGAVVSERGNIEIDRKLCSNCGKCVEVCPAEAVRLLGKYVSLEEVIKVVEEDGPFYRRSRGGITIGGGEPLFQAEFVAALLQECRRRGIDAAIETSGYARWEDLEKVCQYANLIFFDIKVMDPIKHESFTGVRNELILANIKNLSRAFPKIPIIARTPIVPGYTDSEENIRATVDFLSAVKSLRGYEIKPYHGFGEPKYHQLGRWYSLCGLNGPSKERMVILRNIRAKIHRQNRSPRWLHRCSFRSLTERI